MRPFFRGGIALILLAPVLVCGPASAGVPSAPSHLMATPGDGMVTLAWKPTPGAVGYRVKQASSAAGAATVIASNLTATAFTHVGLTNGRTFFYAVSALGPVGEGPDAPRLRVIPSAAVLDLLPAGAKVEKLAGGFQFIEGPVWVPRDGGSLIFSDIPGNRLIRWTPAAATTFRQPSGQANGNTLDALGRLITAEHANRRVSRTELDGGVVPLVTEYGGKRFNAPNDVVVKSDGTVWFTDPNYGSGPLQPGRYLYRFDPADGDGTVTLVGSGFDQPNGLAFSPDEKLLYVADSGGPHHVRMFDVQPDNTLTNSRVFTVISPGVPDGMRVDAQGRLFSSAGDGVQIFSPAGALIGRLRTPETAANVCFGGPQGDMIFITANTGLYGVSRMPDLVVTAIHRFPASPQIGHPVHFSAVVKNQGTAPAGGVSSFRVALTIGTQTNLLWSEAFAVPLAPDASVVLPLDQGTNAAHWVASAGTVSLRATVDGPGTVAESNETNNTLNATLTVTPPPADADGDGAGDPDEALAGTDPGSATSVLKVLGVRALGTAGFEVTWSSVAGRRYQLTCQGTQTGAGTVAVGDAVTADGDTAKAAWAPPAGVNAAVLRVAALP